jgi:hypothetical protein
MAYRSMAAVMENASVSRFAATVVPTRHIYTNRIFMTAMKIRCTLIQIQFTARPYITFSTGTVPRRQTFTTIQTGLVANSCNYKEKIQANLTG